MKPILYYLRISGPCRSVELLIDALKLDVEKKHLDLFQGAHLTPEFLKLNANHTVPVLQDDKVTIAESRAIMCYLINRYAPDSPLYPKDPIKRAYIDRALYWEATALYPAIRSCFFPIIRLNQTKVNQDNVNAAAERLEMLNEELGRTKYFGNNEELTIADLSLLALWSNVLATGFWDVSKYGNISSWYLRVKGLNRISEEGWKDLVEERTKEYAKMIHSKLN